MRLTKIMDDPSYGGCGGVILAKCENCTNKLPSCYEEDCGIQNEANQKLAIIENMLCDAYGNEIISLDRLRELTKAKREKRLIILPYGFGAFGQDEYWRVLHAPDWCGEDSDCSCCRYAEEDNCRFRPIIKKISAKTVYKAFRLLYGLCTEKEEAERVSASDRRGIPRGIQTSVCRGSRAGRRNK